MYSSNTSAMQMQHDLLQLQQQQQERHRQGGIQQRQQQPQQQQITQSNPIIGMHQQHHQQGVQYQFETATTMVASQQQRRQPQQQQNMNVSNTLLGVYQAQHQQHNQQQQKQHQMMLAQQQHQLLLQQQQSFENSPLDYDGFPTTQDNAKQQKLTYQRQVKADIFFHILENYYGWEKIISYSSDVFIYKRPGANDPNNLVEGIDIIRSEYISSGRLTPFIDSGDILIRRYNELYIKYVLTTEIGRHFLQLNSSILETDEVQQDREDDTTSNSAKRQRLEQQDESLSITKQKMEDAYSVLEQARENLIDKQHLYQKKVKLQSELDQQKQHYDAPDNEIFASISKEVNEATGDSNEVYDAVSEDIITRMMEMTIDRTTFTQQEDFAIKALSMSLYKMLERKRHRISDDIKTGQSNVQDALADKVKAEKQYVTLTAEANGKEKHYREAKEEHDQVVVASQQQQQKLHLQQQQVHQQGPQNPRQEGLSIQYSLYQLQQQEAKRQEAELRAKIKTSLHSQHVSREVVEEEVSATELINEQRMAKPVQSVKIVTADIADLDNYYADLDIYNAKEEAMSLIWNLQQRLGNGVTLSLRFVQIDVERYPLPATIRKELTNTLIQRLSTVVVDENNNVKGAFQLSYCKPRSDEPNVKVYGIPLDRLSSVDDDDFFNTKTFVNQREFAKQYQVTLPLPEVQVVSAIEQASSSDEPPIAALQQILNNTYHGNNNNTLSQEERPRQYFFFKGVVYFVWIDVPPEVLRLLKETCKEVYEDVMAVKIGESGEDLMKHLKKMMILLTYLAGAKLCWIAIGIPFGLCKSRMVEQWIHFIKLELRKSGEWHSREVLSLETINHILNRTGGKVICRGTVSHGGQSGNGTVRTGGQEDGPGWIYFFRQLFTEEELRELWKMYRELPEGEGRHFIRFLLAFKVGASRDKDSRSRPRANFWAMVRGCGEFVAVKGFSKVFEQEARLHKHYKDLQLQLCGERFVLIDADGNSEIESLLKLLRNDDRYNIEEGKLHREHEKRNYLEGETKEWIRRDFISLVEFVDLMMKGVVGHYKR